MQQKMNLLFETYPCMTGKDRVSMENVVSIMNWVSRVIYGTKMHVMQLLRNFLLYVHYATDPTRCALTVYIVKTMTIGIELHHRPIKLKEDPSERNFNKVETQSWFKQPPLTSPLVPSKSLTIDHRDPITPQMHTKLAFLVVNNDQLPPSRLKKLNPSTNFVHSAI